MSVRLDPDTDPDSDQADREVGSGRGVLGTTRACLALLRERGWLAALAGIVILSVVFVFLGRWQFHRHEARTARNNLIHANYDAKPVPLATLIPAGQQVAASSLPETLEWRQVTVTGQYLTDETILVRNRAHDQIGQAGSVGVGGNSQNGYEVVVPLRTGEGTVLFVDRGWIPAGTTDASRPDSVPQAPQGEVTVVARLRPSEEASDRTAPAGQAMRINIPALAAEADLAAGDRVVGAFGALVSEDPPAADTPEAAAEPDTGIGINLSYSVQWDGFALVAYILFAIAMVREVRRRDEENDEPEDADEDGSQGGNHEPPLTGATYR